MSYFASENILDEPIPTTFDGLSPQGEINRGGFVMQKLWRLKNWVASVVPESVKSTVSSKFKSLSDAVSGVVNTVTSRFFTPNTPESREPAEPAEPGENQGNQQNQQNQQNQGK